MYCTKDLQGLMGLGGYVDAVEHVCKRQCYVHTYEVRIYLHHTQSLYVSTVDYMASRSGPSFDRACVVKSQFSCSTVGNCNDRGGGSNRAGKPHQAPREEARSTCTTVDSVWSMHSFGETSYCSVWRRRTSILQAPDAKTVLVALRLTF